MAPLRELVSAGYSIGILWEGRAIVREVSNLSSDMYYQLENVETGESITLNPDRTLIGAAEHATICTDPSGPFLAALVVSYPTGWAVHGLADEGVEFNDRPLRVARQVTPRTGDVLKVADQRFRFVAPDSHPEPADDIPAALPSCYAYIRFPDGMEECRSVDHNLLFGRLKTCHVRFPDNKLSRLNALFAAHHGTWYVHTLAKGMIARNRHAVSDYAILEDGDELIIGPLNVRIEMQATIESHRPAHIPDRFEPAREANVSHDPSDCSVTPSSFGSSTPTVETTLPPPEVPPGLAAVYVAGIKLDQWLKAQRPQAQPSAGFGSWIDHQRERLKRFWYDTPETTTARALRAAGKPDEAFALLEKAIRARPDSPDLLRELYRLYDSVGLAELGFRPLRQIEKLAQARGSSDTWVLETLARLCERLGKKRPSMFDRAVGYWTKLEQATGVSHSREKAATMASRTLCESGYSRIALDNA